MRDSTPALSASLPRAPSGTAPVEERISERFALESPSSRPWPRCCKTKGRGVFQLVSDSYRTTDDEFAASEFSLISEIARTSQRPVSFTVQQDFEAPERWRDLMALASSLQLEGLDVKAQVAPRPIGVLLGLQASANVFTPVRAYARVAALPLEERVVALQNPELRRKILDSHAALTTGDGRLRRTRSSMGASTRCSSSTNRSTTTSTPASHSARPRDALGVDPREFAYDVQLQREGRQLIYTPLFNFVDGNLDAVREMITSPVAMFGLSDGGAHCGAICDASMTTSYMTLVGS